MGNSNDGPFLAASSGQAVVLSPEVGALGAYRCPGGLAQGCLEPPIALHGPTALTLASAFAVAGTDRGPATEMIRTGKLVHIRPDFGDDVLG